MLRSWSAQKKRHKCTESRGNLLFLRQSLSDFRLFELHVRHSSVPRAAEEMEAVKRPLHDQKANTHIIRFS